MDNRQYANSNSVNQHWYLVELEQQISQLGQIMNQMVKDFNNANYTNDYGEQYGYLEEALSDYHNVIDSLRGEYVEKYNVYIRTLKKEHGRQSKQNLKGMF